MADSLKTRRELTAGGKTYHYHSLKAAEDAGLSNIHRLPYSLKILLENQLRHELWKKQSLKRILKRSLTG